MRIMHKIWMKHLWFLSYIIHFAVILQQPLTERTRKNIALIHFKIKFYISPQIFSSKLTAIVRTTLQNLNTFVFNTINQTVRFINSTTPIPLQIAF